MTPDALLAAITAVANVIDTFGRLHLVRLEKLKPEQVQEAEQRHLDETRPWHELGKKLTDLFMKGIGNG